MLSGMHCGNVGSVGLWPAMEPLPNPGSLADQTLEYARTEWLINCFNTTFLDYQTILVRGSGEPEYLPATASQPAKIQFAHGFFSSALHEISHWCIAGAARRLLPDLGYWYAPDGRNAEQQRQFEQVEIRPQAVEWLLHMACNLPFQVSRDNLSGEPECSDPSAPSLDPAERSTRGTDFASQVHRHALAMLVGEATIPRDAQRLIGVLCQHIRAGKPLSVGELNPSACQTTHSSQPFTTDPNSLRQTHTAHTAHIDRQQTGLIL